jgi:hypothetical protein
MMKKEWCLTASLIVSFLISATMPVQSWASGSNIWAGIGANPAGVAYVNKGVPLSNSGTTGDMLQFKANNHVLGFQPTKAHLVALNHALSIEFLDTLGVMPKSADTASSAGNPGGAQAMGKVVYQDLWPGISLTYESIKDEIAESTYHVAAGADVSRIRLRYNVPVEAQEDGSLRFQFGAGYITESSPVAWQEIEGKRIPVLVTFKVSGQEVGFSLGKYDPRLPLIIDPTYSWHTFYGGYVRDYGCGIAVDSAGNIYITGYSGGWGNPLNAFTGGYDIFVLKLNSAGAYQWHTFFGSASDDHGYSIAIDGVGNVYVTGDSWGTWGSPLHAHSNANGPSNIFVLKLNSSGIYQWHTFYGTGSVPGYTGKAIAIDTSGNVYVTGDGAGTWGSPLHALNNRIEMVVLKLSSSGAYLWHTFHGSEAHDSGNGIATDSTGNVYVTGTSYGPWNGPSDEPPINPYHYSTMGSNHLFILKLDSNGAYQWHTFYGTTNYHNEGKSIAVDGSGNVYVAGSSYLTWGSPLNAYSGQNDILVLKLNSSGIYQWHTFHGSVNNDYAYGLAIGNEGNVYVTGKSNTSWGSPRNPHSGNNDIFVLKLNSDGTYNWNTFYGSSSDDIGNGIDIDADGNVFITGESNASWGSPLNAYNRMVESFVLKMMMAYDTNRESIYSIIQNCLADPISSEYCNLGGEYEPINETTVFRNPRHTIINSEGIISPWYDGDWQNEITNSNDTGFNTIHKGTPLPTDKFEVISYVDEVSPICGTQNANSYFFTYTTRYTLGKYAVTVDRWIDYLKSITLDYGRRIDTLTIFSHATAGDVQMSEAFHLTEQTAPLFSRLKNENILAPNATILLFACQAGAGEAGQRFVQALANASCATVYANTEYTGNSTKLNNADWDLDVVKQPNIELSGDSDTDGDVDGSDLAALIANAALLDIATFAQNFGRNACQ